MQVPRPLTVPSVEVTVVLDPNTGQIGLRCTVANPYLAMGLLQQGIYMLLKKANRDGDGGPSSALLVASGALPSKGGV